MWLRPGYIEMPSNRSLELTTKFLTWLLGLDDPEIEWSGNKRLCRQDLKTELNPSWYWEPVRKRVSHWAFVKIVRICQHCNIWLSVWSELSVLACHNCYLLKFSIVRNSIVWFSALSKWSLYNYQYRQNCNFKKYKPIT